LREEERRFIAAALIALERIVEVGAVDRDVRVDRPLARDDQAEAIRLLHDGRRQLHELREITAAYREILDRPLGNRRARRRADAVEQRRGGHEHRLGHRAWRQRQREALGFADGELHTSRCVPSGILKRRLDRVHTDRQRRSANVPWNPSLLCERPVWPRVAR
jgi:hypothetical protein